MMMMSHRPPGPPNTSGYLATALPRQGEHVYGRLALRHALVPDDDDDNDQDYDDNDDLMPRVAAEEGGHPRFLSRLDSLDVEFGSLGVGRHKLEQAVRVCHL